MVNQLILVGRLVKDPELQLTENGKKISIITLAVPRTYKNVSGEYDTDFLDCTLWTGVAENTSEYCKTGDIIGVKGRLQSRLIEKEDGTKYKRMEIVAERVSFLASSKGSKEEPITVSDEENDTCNDGIESKKNDKSEKKKK